MIKLTEQRELSPYVLVHPGEKWWTAVAPNVRCWEMNGPRSDAGRKSES